MTDLNEFGGAILTDAADRDRVDSPVLLTTSPLRLRLAVHACIEAANAATDDKLEAELRRTAFDLLGRPAELAELADAYT